MVNSRQFGEAIRACRVRRKITLAELSAITGLGINTLSRLERGEGNTQFNVILKVLETLGLEISIQSVRNI